jgi:hypothetical protein
MVMLIPLTKSTLVAMVDDEDFALVNRWLWHPQHSASGGCYAVRSHKTEGRTRAMRMHRLILNAPAGIPVDHADGDGLNNQRANLRLATNQLNSANSRRPLPASGFRGVYAYDKKPGFWRAQMKLEGRSIHIGCFKCPIEAARAYDAAALQAFGEFATLNFGDVR